MRQCSLGGPGRLSVVSDPKAMLFMCLPARLLCRMLPKLSGPRGLHPSTRENTSCPFSGAAGQTELSLSVPCI